MAAHDADKLTILKFDSDGALTYSDHLALDTGDAPTAVTHDSVHNRVYVACSGTARVVYANYSSTGEFSISTIYALNVSSSVLDGISDIKYDTFNSRLYTAAESADTVAAIDVDLDQLPDPRRVERVTDPTNLNGAKGLAFRTNLGNDLPGLTAVVVGCFEGDMATLLQVTDTVAY